MYFLVQLLEFQLHIPYWFVYAVRRFPMWIQVIFVYSFIPLALMNHTCTFGLILMLRCFTLRRTDENDPSVMFVRRYGRSSHRRNPK